MFTSLGEQAPHLLSAQQHTAEAQMRDENRVPICEVESRCPVNTLSENVLIDVAQKILVVNIYNPDTYLSKSNCDRRAD